MASSSLALLRSKVQNNVANLAGKLSGQVDIKTMTQGISVTGAQQYLQEIKVNGIDKAIEALQNTETFTNVFRTHWQGRAEANFETNMNKAISLIASQLNTIKENIETQVSDMIEDWANQDEALVAIDDSIVSDNFE